MVVPTLKDDLVPLYEQPDAEVRGDRPAAIRRARQLKSCNGTWCEFAGKNFDGWIRQDRLWGAYPNEKVD